MGSSDLSVDRRGLKNNNDKNNNNDHHARRLSFRSSINSFFLVFLVGVGAASSNRLDNGRINIRPGAVSKWNVGVASSAPAIVNRDAVVSTPYLDAENSRVDELENLTGKGESWNDERSWEDSEDEEREDEDRGTMKPAVEEGEDEERGAVEPEVAGRGGKERRASRPGVVSSEAKENGSDDAGKVRN